MPEGAVYVGRPSKWGNPFYAIEPYRWSITIERRAEIRRELGGKDLACWCPLDKPCHADVLLEIANDEQNVAKEGP
jgi:hypothetical protein